MGSAAAAPRGLTCIMVADKPERRKLCLLLLPAVWSCIPWPGSSGTGSVAPRQGSEEDGELGAWCCAAQRRPRALIAAGLYLHRALCSFLTVSPGSFCSGNECQAEPSNALCKDERSQSRIGKQLLPYYTWPCTRRVHHHAVVTLTRRVAQKSCRVQSVLDKQRDAALLCLRDTISGDQDTIAG